ncbi:unnamed protein product [Allacma fusca]|uniref:Zinc finger MYM-type protein 1 n=1 Tax=Allacma fusca TaxID=39272 RepID=A0A8J2L3L4_9HEXA|nr:unnamed protein product [Allacma fusca]
MSSGKQKKLTAWFSRQHEKSVPQLVDSCADSSFSSIPEDAQEIQRVCSEPVKLPKATSGNKRIFVFQQHWLTEFKWLELNSDERAFCKICQQTMQSGLFLESMNIQERFISEGFIKWKDGLRKFRAHQRSKQHCFAVTKLAAFKSKSIISVNHENLLNKQHEARIALRSMFTSAIFLATQGLPFLGDIFKKGNYFQLLTLRSSDVPELMHFMRRSKPLTCSDIQNEMIKIISLAISRKIQARLNENKEFSIIVDETTDISGREQVSLCVRSVSSDLNVSEDFLGFYQTDSKKSNTLVAIIKDVLIRFGLEITNIRGQCFDGAANMSGMHHGVAKQMLEMEPRALFVHCYAHRLNLAIQDSVRSITLLRDGLSHVHEIGVMLKGSAKRLSIYEAVKQQFHEEESSKGIKPQPLCETRWTVRGRNVTAIIKNYATILEFLRNLGESNDKVAVKANGLFSQLLKAETYFGLLILQSLLLPTENLSKVIQSKQSTVSGIIKAAAETISILESYKLTDNFSQIWNSVHDAAKKFELETPSVGRIRKAPKRFSGQSPKCFNTPEEKYRSLMIESASVVITEMKRRFDQESIKVIQQFENILLNWKLLTSQDRTKHLNMLSENYGIDPEQFDLQMKMIYNTNRIDVSNILSFIESFKSLEPGIRGLFSEVQKFLKLIMVVPISSATAERTFSILRRIKDYLRSTMAQGRLNHCCIIQCLADLAKELNIQDLMEDFINNANRKLIFGNLETK